MSDVENYCKGWSRERVLKYNEYSHHQFNCEMKDVIYNIVIMSSTFYKNESGVFQKNVEFMRKKYGPFPESLVKKARWWSVNKWSREWAGKHYENPWM